MYDDLMPFQATDPGQLDVEIGISCYFATFGVLNQVTAIGWKLQDRTYAHLAATVGESSCSWIL